MIVMRAALLAWREGCPWRGNGKRATKGLAAKSKPPVAEPAQYIIG